MAATAAAPRAARNGRGGRAPPQKPKPKPKPKAEPGPGPGANGPAAGVPDANPNYPSGNGNNGNGNGNGASMKTRNAKDINRGPNGRYNAGNINDNINNTVGNKTRPPNAYVSNRNALPNNNINNNNNDARYNSRNNNGISMSRDNNGNNVARASDLDRDPADFALPDPQPPARAQNAAQRLASNAGGRNNGRAAGATRFSDTATRQIEVALANILDKVVGFEISAGRAGHHSTQGLLEKVVRFNASFFSAYAYPYLVQNAPAAYENVCQYIADKLQWPEGGADPRAQSLDLPVLKRIADSVLLDKLDTLVVTDDTGNGNGGGGGGGGGGNTAPNGAAR
jgi:hypothetical protein